MQERIFAFTYLLLAYLLAVVFISFITSAMTRPGHLVVADLIWLDTAGMLRGDLFCAGCTSSLGCKQPIREYYDGF